MDFEYPLKQMRYGNCVTVSDDKLVTFSANGAGISFDIAQNSVPQDVFLEARYLSFDIEVQDDLSSLVLLNFYQKDNAQPPLYVLLGLLPQVKTCVCFDLEALKGDRLFWEPMSYNLKQVVFGAHLPKEEIVSVELAAAERMQPLVAIMSDFSLSTELPTFEPVDVILCNKYGQSTLRKTANTVNTDEELLALMKPYKNETLQDAQYARSKYGGDKTKKLDDGTGFFRTHHDGKRWWLVDPEGYLYLSSGVVCVEHNRAPGRLKGKENLFEKIEPKDGPFAPAWSYRDNSDEFDFGVSNLIRAYGDTFRSDWEEFTYKRLKNWGFTTIGAWSDFDFARRYTMPYTITIDKVRDFPTTDKKVFRDFPDVFDPSYLQASEYYAGSLEALKDDPCMIGYFMRNEPEWGFVTDICIAEQMLDNAESLVSKDSLIDYLRDKYKEIAALNKAWHKPFVSFDDLQKPMRNACSFSEQARADLRAFSEIMIRKYVEIPSKACREVDDKHLNLGMRYAFISDPTLIAGWENFDVFSINSYTISPYSQIDTVSKMVDRPIVIGEFHFGSPESGMHATGLRAVPTQKERGVAYKYYMSEAIKHPAGIGAHYFTLSDQAMLGRFDGENYQIGIVDVTHTPYYDFAQGICEFNEAMYRIADGTLPPFDTVPEELPRIAY